MITPYLVYKELLPCGRMAWRRMVNPQFSQVPAIDVAYHLKTKSSPYNDSISLWPKYTSYGIQHHSTSMLGQPSHRYHNDSHNTNTIAAEILTAHVLK